jgi:hypothetical protein
MPSRAHDRSHFFKYATYDTALKVLRSKSFRWSSPIKFNDPFDSQIGFVLDSNQNAFAMVYAASLEREYAMSAVESDEQRGVGYFL